MIGIVIDPVPVTGFAENFSPIPRIAPPPFGRPTWGALTANDGAFASLAVMLMELFPSLISVLLSYCGTRPARNLRKVESPTPRLLSLTDFLEFSTRPFVVTEF